jgi:hypothetical protein
MITLNGTTGITTPTYGGAVTSEYIAPVTSFKNRIINGAMQIDQRNAGAAVTRNDEATYVLDRYFAQDATDGTFTVQQSSVAPAGFTNSMLITVTTADASLAAGQLARVVQRIEGFNVADLGWGTAGAQTVTLSFWVRSSVTGAFGGALSNSAFNRSYPFTYTISAANTWEQKTITIVGDTTGTWLTNNGIGLEINFGLGVGSTFSGTAGAWSGSGLMSSTGATNLLATSGATFYITGVQLEKGSNATSFDYRPYGTELALCQRYFQKSFNIDVAPANNTADNAHDISSAFTTASTDGARIYYTTAMRSSPTVVFYSTNGATGVWAAFTGTWVDMTTTVTSRLSQTGFTPRLSRTGTFTTAGSYGIRGNWTADAEL